jgi:hypothetical protein
MVVIVMAKYDCFFWGGDRYTWQTQWHKKLLFADGRNQTNKKSVSPAMVSVGKLSLRWFHHDVKGQWSCQFSSFSYS